MKGKPWIKLTGGKGFHITFENGVTVSVQFSLYNYVEGHNNPGLLGIVFNPEYKEMILVDEEAQDVIMKGELKQGLKGSPDAEIAMWDKNGDWITSEYTKEGDSVMGYQTPDQVLEAMIWAKNYKSKAKEVKK